MKSLKQRLKANHSTVGSWITLPSPAIAEIMAKSNLDWVTIDMEHSPITFSQAEELIRVIDLCGKPPLVRVGDNNALIIKRVMDMGAHGVIVPMVNSRAQAEKAVQAVKYPPEGTRGVGLARAQRYGLTFKEYKKWQAKESAVIVQIEHIDAIEALEEILSVEGVDASLIGPYDLSASMGYPGEFDRKEVKAAVNHYRRVCKKLRKPAGFHVIAPESKLIAQKKREGFSFIAFSLDALLLSKKIEDELRNLK